jgi:microcompartment protein CcmK/EutM
MTETVMVDRNGPTLNSQAARINKQGAAVYKLPLLVKGSAMRQLFCCESRC